MSNDDWFLMAAVIVAFIAGYSVVSFIATKIKSQQPPTNPGPGPVNQPQPTEAKLETVGVEEFRPKDSGDF